MRNTPPSQLPWQQPLWQTIAQRLHDDTLPHALLLSGAHGVGKNHLARLLAHALLCRQRGRDALPCGECRDCQLCAAQTHPDFLQVVPHEAGKVISVDQIRGVGQYMALKSHAGGYKVVLISPAEQMNLAAANSLLKTLEEPPSDALLILVSSRAATLTATVRSRCQQLSVARPSQQQALQWLQQEIDGSHDLPLLLTLADGAPLRALQMARDGLPAHRAEMLQQLIQLATGRSDPLAVASKWLKFGHQDSLYWMRTWIEDMIRLRSTSTPPRVINDDIRPQLLDLSAHLTLQQLHTRLDKAIETARLIERQCNAQLLLEDLLIGWAK